MLIKITLLKNRLWHRCFPVNFAKLPRTTFLTEDLRWLLPSFSSLKNKRQKINEEHLSSVNLVSSVITKYSHYIESFKQKVKQGPFYVCVVSNRCHYDRNVIIFKCGVYSHDFITKINTTVLSFDHKFYICKTCNASAKKEKVPCQAVVSGLQLENVHKELIVLVLLR